MTGGELAAIAVISLCGLVIVACLIAMFFIGVDE